MKLSDYVSPSGQPGAPARQNGATPPAGQPAPQPGHKASSKPKPKRRRGPLWYVFSGLVGLVFTLSFLGMAAAFFLYTWVA